MEKQSKVVVDPQTAAGLQELLQDLLALDSPQPPRSSGPQK